MTTDSIRARADDLFFAVNSEGRELNINDVALELAMLITALAELIDELTPAAPAPTSVIIRHARGLSELPLGAIISSNATPHYFMHAPDDLWRPCDATGQVLRLRAVIDWFASDQILLPAQLVRR